MQRPFTNAINVAGAVHSVQGYSAISRANTHCGMIQTGRLYRAGAGTEIKPPENYVQFIDGIDARTDTYRNNCQVLAEWI